MLQPKTQITPPCAQGTKPHAKSTTVNSSSNSHSPRVKKNRESSCSDFPRLVERKGRFSQEREDRGTIMSDKASKEKGGRGVRHVLRSKALVSHEVPRVIQRHDDHDQSTQDNRAAKRNREPCVGRGGVVVPTLAAAGKSIAVTTHTSANRSRSFIHISIVGRESIVDFCGMSTKCNKRDRQNLSRGEDAYASSDLNGQAGFRARPFLA